MFQPSNSLRQAVESGNAYKVRGALIGIIQADPGFQTGRLDDAISYAESHGVSPFEAQNDPQLPMSSEEAWDSAYFASSVTYLRENFTKDRLEHVRKVGRKTHPEVARPTEQAIPTDFTARKDSQPKKEKGRRMPSNCPGPAAPHKLALALLVLAAIVVVVVLVRKAVHH